MLDGVMLLWFLLTALSVLFVAVDIRSTPESPVLKWGFVLLTAYTGPLGAFLYVLGCREPLPGMHEQYVAARWRQVLGSTMHCVAGDGVGIIAGALIAAHVKLPVLAGMALEYVLGFGFGWLIFQALFMRDMVGGSYALSLRRTFTSELLSMNCLMAGMLPAMHIPWHGVAGAEDPASPVFWFKVSMALLVGFITAYPMNWWLVSRKLKHGMMTVRRAPDTKAVAMDHAAMGHAVSMGDASMHHGDAMPGMKHDAPTVTRGQLVAMTVLSLALLLTGIVVSIRFGGH